MKTSNIISYSLAALTMGLLLSSCSLDTSPKDALNPSLTWDTPDAAKKFAIGCYDEWESGSNILYNDCTSDFGYNNFPWEGYKEIGNGTMNPTSGIAHRYDFTIIKRCNTFLDKVKDIKFDDEAEKKDLIGQVRFIRAYQYFIMNWTYGGVPIIGNYETAAEAVVPRKTEKEVRDFVDSELDTAISELKVDAPRGTITKGGAMFIRMRSALYYGDYAKAKEMAEAIINLKKYNLESSYAKLFNVEGQGSAEIILATQYINSTKPLSVIGQMYNNRDGGWSSIVPTQELVDVYEMNDGKTIDESSEYDATHPFANRDPRMAMTIVYPGSDFNGKIVNTLDKNIGEAKNENYPTSADNASKTGLTWRKYLDNVDQYSGGIWNTNACPIVGRYAEVLLTYAEAENELNGPSDAVYSKIDDIRTRVGMPKADRNKYNTKETLRELIRRERAVEFAGEGLRRADILRWKDNSGRMLAETLLNRTIYRLTGTVDKDEKKPEMRAKIFPQKEKIETRVFKVHNRYYPIPQSAIDKNAKLKPNNKGYN